MTLGGMPTPFVAAAPEAAEPPAHVLVLDDDVATLALASRVLGRQGYRVSTADSAEQAQDLAAKELPDLIIIDYDLGTGETGLDFFRRLRAGGMDLPAMLVTGFTSEERVMEALRSGVADVLPKTTGYLDFLPAAVERVLTPIRLQRRVARAEEASRLEHYYRGIAEAIPHLVWTAREDGEFEYFSQQWLDFTGLPPEQQLGRGWITSVVHPDDQGKTGEALATAIHERKRFAVVHRLRAADSTWRWFRTAGAPLLAPGSLSPRWFGTSTDITDQKIAEDDREALLASERAARTEAEHAAKLKDEFVVTLSHELRTPLHAIIGWVDILLRTPPDKERLQKALEVIQRNAKLQAQMVSDLLEMSSILSGRLRLEVQRLDLAGIIEQVVMTVLPAAEAKQIRITKILGSAGAIQGDPARLQQMIWNLLTNAIKFTPKGGKVQVTLAREHSEIVVTVSDTGKGISAQFLPHVFDRFRQEDTGLQRQSGGLGLGLAIVKQLTELHGGRVYAYSEGDNQGSTFTLRFPVPSAHAPNPALQAASTATAAPRTLDGIRVLVLEDDTDARELVEQLLRDAGAVVSSASNGAQGLSLLAAAQPDVVLSDVGMPGMDGYEFVRRMRKQDQELNRNAAPAIALTALARTEDRQSALLAGFQAHIAKPVNPTELIVVVASLVGRVGRLEAR
jgi:PAS domain S-box-containing protein